MAAFDPLAALRVDSPFIGLRSFEPGDAHLFFGRERQVEELLQRLGQNRLLAVVGASGCGKSSLVRAGLLPDLYRGYLRGATSRWRIAVMKPGPDPLRALKDALEGPGALGKDQEGRRAATLRETSHGLLDAVKQAQPAFLPGESLLLVVDQFEEIFRAASSDPAREAEAAHVVSSILEAVQAFDSRVYVVLTMRSDYLGQCARHPGLAEAMNRSQYLVPRLGREQRQRAIEQPLRLAGVAVAPGLVQHILNEVGDDPAELPVLQHVLMRTFGVWREASTSGPIDFEHYEDPRVGGCALALEKHAEALFAAFTPSAASFAGKTFRTLATLHEGRAVRRRVPLDRVFALVGAETPQQREEVKEAIRRFTAPENNLLTASDPDLRGGDLDITHESLIARWSRLKTWVKDENESAECYRELARDVANGSALWQDPDLQRAELLRRTQGWTPAWAAQDQDGRPRASFEDVVAFLERSRRAARSERRRRIVVPIVGASMAALLVLSGLYAWSIERAWAAAEADALEKTRGLAEANNRLERLQHELLFMEDQLKDTKTQLLYAKNDQQKKVLEALLLQQQASVDQARAAARQLEKSRTDAMQAAGQHERELAGRINDLESQLKAAQLQSAAAQDKAKSLQAALDRLAPFTPLTVVIKEYSHKNLSEGPFRGGDVGLLLDDLEHSSTAQTRLYLLRGEQNRLEAPFDFDKDRARKWIALIAPRTGCYGASSDRQIWCFAPQRQPTRERTQALGTFAHDGFDYEVRSVGWNRDTVGNIDSLTVLINRVNPAAPRAN